MDATPFFFEIGQTAIKDDLYFKIAFVEYSRTCPRCKRDDRCRLYYDATGAHAWHHSLKRRLALGEILPCPTVRPWGTTVVKAQRVGLSVYRVWVDNGSGFMIDELGSYPDEIEARIAARMRVQIERHVAVSK